jgi:hypothetical protein
MKRGIGSSRTLMVQSFASAASSKNPVIPSPRPKSFMPVSVSPKKFVLNREQLAGLADYIKAKQIANEAVAFVEKMKAGALTLVQLAGGTVTMGNVILKDTPSISYAYSAALTRQKLALRNAEKIEQLNGKAKRIERACLVMSQVQV